MPTFEFKRLKRTIIIYRTVQTVLVALLIFVALQFQHQFALLGKSQQFISTIITAVVIQLILLYPIYKLAWRDAGIMIEGCATGLTKEQQTALRKKSLMSDLWKFSGIAFYIAFVALAPDIKKASGAPLVLATIIFSFLITCLTYFQCFNFSAKKRMKDIS